MSNTQDYRFRIDTAFYDRLHSRLDQVRTEGNDASQHFPVPSVFRSVFLHAPEVLPSRQHLAEIVDAAFWASLEKEEGRPVRFKIGYRPKEYASQDEIGFMRPIAYSAASIAKLAPSCGDDGHLLVAPFPDGLRIFGRATGGQSYFEVNAIDPGQLLLRADERNRAAISGSEIIFIRDGMLGIYGKMWSKPGEGSETNPEFDTRRSVLVNIARGIRRLGHGGAVILTPSDESWRCCVSGIEYESAGQPGKLRRMLDLQAYETEKGTKHIIYADYVEFGIREIVGLTQVDGAVLLRSDLSLIGFGAKLRPGSDEASAEVYEIDPFDHDDLSTFRKAESVGGMRHTSAARFVQDNPSALAIVVSEDGIVSCFVSQLVDGIERVVRYKRLELTLF
jgi:hypothetical protein